MNYTLRCGEASELMAKELEDNSIDLTVTSPPYDKLRKYKQYTFDLCTVIQQLYRVTKNGGVVVWVIGDETIDGGETGTSFRHALSFMEYGFKLTDTMIYVKNSSTPNVFQKRYVQSFEYMFVFAKGFPVKTFNPLMRPNKLAGKPKTPRAKMQRDGIARKYGTNSSPEYHKESKRSNVWTYNTGAATGDDKISFKHPAPFPEALALDHILSWSNPNDVVFDPMMGSGTTGKMALLNGRRFVGYDISQEYVDLARERIELALAKHSLDTTTEPVA